MSAVHYDSYSDARVHLKELLDAAERGRPATVRRDRATAAVVGSERLRHFLASVISPGVQVVAEADRWSAFIPGLPVAAEGETFDEAITAMVSSLQEYADDWQDHLLDAPNHRDNWGLVHLIRLSDNDQLREWLIESGRSDGRHVTTREDLHQLVQGLTDDQVAHAVVVEGDNQVSVVLPSPRPPRRRPASLGLGRSGHGDLSTRGDELLAEGFGQ